MSVLENSTTMYQTSHCESLHDVMTLSFLPVEEGGFFILPVILMITHEVTGGIGIQYMIFFACCNAVFFLLFSSMKLS